MTLRRDLIASAIAVLVLTVVFGLAYPLLITGVSQVVFADAADGTLVERDGKVVGSELIGQDFRKPVIGPDGQPEEDEEGEPVLEADPQYFQSRPSQSGYSASATFFSNLGPNNSDLRDLIAANADTYLALEGPFNPGLTKARIPADAVQQSASGVDPHISQRNAELQAGRVASVRRLPKARVLELVDENVDGRGLGVFGEPGVNVLKLNLAIDEEAR